YRTVLYVSIFPYAKAFRKLAALVPNASRDNITQASPVRRTFRDLLVKLAALSPGSSPRVERAILMAEPPSMDKGEITDKGSINQRAVLKNRSALVDVLYALPLSSRVIAGEGKR